MARTSRFILLLFLVGAGLVFGPAFAVDPGESVDLRGTASVSPCLAEVLLDPDAPAGAEADAGCDEIAGSLQARVVLAELVETTLDAAASAAVVYEFEVGAESGTEGNMVDGILAYGISWRGVTKVTGAGVFLATIKLAVEDITDPGMPVAVASVLIHEQDAGTGVDEGNRQDMLSLNLTRGHSFRVTASLATSATTEATEGPASAVADYLSDVGSEAAVAGVWVDVLALQIGFDLEALAAQVEANAMAIENLAKVAAINTEAIDANTKAIASLAEVVGLLADEVAAVKEALGDLSDVVANHTHRYLTGKGVGHNNTLAETGPPTGDDDDGPVATPKSNGNSRRGRARR